MLLPPDIQRHAGKYYGKYSGLVTDAADPLKLGRITVTVPSVFGPEMPVRARPCLPFGHFFVPAVGTNVWVEFEGGDPNYPLWVGTWYPDGAVPAEAQRDPPVNRVMQTPSGHTIELLDEEGEEKIVIRHKGQSFVSIDKDGGVLISNQNGSHLFLNAKDEEATLVEQHGNYIRLTADGVSIVNNEGAAAINLQGDLVRIIGGTIALEGSSVVLGAGASEAVTLGKSVQELWLAFMTHTHPTGVGPSGPPVPPLRPYVPITDATLAVLVK